jgi:uncharacterized membrane protein
VRSVLLARHAQHVVLIHFPVALFLSAVAFDALAGWTRRPLFAAAAWCNLAAAAISTLPAIVTGLLAWQLQLEGQKLKGTLLLHLVFALAAALAIWGVFALHFMARRRHAPSPTPWRWPLALLAVALVVVTAHLGGILSGVNAPG